jgi:tRNA (guanosine-2'-O-)-methyltransferase
VTRRPSLKYIVRTLVQAPAGISLPAGPPPAYMTPQRYQRFLATLARRQPGLTIALEELEDCYNMSDILRTADSVGIGTVHLIYPRGEIPPVSRRAAGSAQKWLDIQVHKSMEELYGELRAQGMRIYATGLIPDAVIPSAVDFTRPTAIVIGNENRGVSGPALAEADEVIYIPMRGMVQSLNVGVAAGIILGEAQRQRAAAGMYDTPQLPEVEWRRILDEWLARERERRKLE